MARKRQQGYRHRFILICAGSYPDLSLPVKAVPQQVNIERQPLSRQTECAKEFNPIYRGMSL